MTAFLLNTVSVNVLYKVLVLNNKATVLYG